MDGLDEGGGETSDDDEAVFRDGYLKISFCFCLQFNLQEFGFVHKKKAKQLNKG